jgi:hypothetical protein
MHITRLTLEQLRAIALHEGHSGLRLVGPGYHPL